MGDATLLHRPTLGLVRARNASSLGTRMSRFLTTTLDNQGYMICSDLARDVDTAAHAASIGTRTIAALGGGVDVIYPHGKRAIDAANSGKWSADFRTTHGHPTPSASFPHAQ